MIPFPTLLNQQCIHNGTLPVPREQHQAHSTTKVGRNLRGIKPHLLSTRRPKFQSAKSAPLFPRSKSSYRQAFRRQSTFFHWSVRSGEGFALSASLAAQHTDVPHPELHWGLTRGNSHCLQHPERTSRARVSPCPEPETHLFHPQHRGGMANASSCCTRAVLVSE